MNREHTPLDETRAARIREEAELVAEFEAHLAHRVDDLVADGLSEGEARERARAEFGDAERLKAESRAVRVHARRRLARASRVDAFRQDFSYSVRQLRRSPGFALTALVTLMLGVGATATIVSVVDAVAFEPLPFDEPDRVVFAEMLTPAGERFSVAEPAFLDWAEPARSFSGMAAFSGWGATMRSPGQPRSIRRDHRLCSLGARGHPADPGRNVRPRPGVERDAVHERVHPDRRFDDSGRLDSADRRRRSAPHGVRQRLQPADGASHGAAGRDEPACRAGRESRSARTAALHRELPARRIRRRDGPPVRANRPARPEDNGRSAHPPPRRGVARWDGAPRLRPQHRRRKPLVRPRAGPAAPLRPARSVDRVVSSWK